jgi:hypothetical protein
VSAQLIGLVLALVSAFGFALSSALQHHANHGVVSAGGAGNHLKALLRTPRWVAGQVLAMISFVLHAVALQFGQLIVVQPVEVSGVVRAVPVRSALDRRWPSRSETGVVAATALGLALFLVVSRPSHGSDPDLSTAGVFVPAALLGAAVFMLIGHRLGGRAIANGFGFGAGVIFGLTAGMMKLAGHLADFSGGPVSDVLSVIWTWPFLTVAILGPAGVLLNQAAYRAGPLSASMPHLHILNVAVSITFGVLVFHEVPRHDPFSLLVEALSLVIVAYGIFRLSRTESVEVLAP